MFPKTDEDKRPINSNELFTERVSAGSRTYFFNVKQTKDGTRYLVITESNNQPSKIGSQRIMVFEENLPAFITGLKKALEFIDTERRL